MGRKTIVLLLLILVMNSIAAVSYPETTKLEKLEEKIKQQQEREDIFFNSPSFERIESVAGFMTFAQGKPIQERRAIGKFSQGFLNGFMREPFRLGGNVMLATGKMEVTIYALGVPEISKKAVAKEFFINAPKRRVAQIKQSWGLE